MNLLLALDGSPASETALGLVAALPWPAGTQAHLLSVVDILHLVGPWTSFASYDAESMGQELGEELHTMLDRAVARLSGTGLVPSVVVAEGRPSSCITGAAEESRADLIVMGSRGHSPLHTLLLGSTSAEVVDHAPCPVLVARRPTVGRILLAHDGSPIAQGAEDVLVRLECLRGIPVEVMSVVRGAGTWSDELAPVAHGRAAVAFKESLEASRMHHEDVARASAERLIGAGIETRAEVRSGDPARTLVDEAETRGIDLIVMGTHGRTGLERLRLGSVARNVLTHARCSVLVVRPLRARTV